MRSAAARGGGSGVEVVELVFTQDFLGRIEAISGDSDTVTLGPGLDAGISLVEQEGDAV